MNRDVKRVMVGELNTSSDYLQILENVKVKLSFKLKNAVEISKMRAAGSKSSLDNVLSKEVKLVGMEGSNDYSEIDEKLARMYSSILGFTEINIYDNFFELGGDSILLSQLYEFIEEEFPGKVTLMELFEYTSIYKLKICGSSEEEPGRYRNN